MADLIKLRHDTAANWTAANPILRLGEPGLETDTNKVKYGDGITTWNSLAYASAGGGGSLTVSASPRLVGRVSAGSGASEEIILGANLSLTGNTLNAASGGSVTGLATVASRAALGAITGQAAGDTRFLTEGLRGGPFEYMLGDYSALVTEDTQQGIYVAASGVATTTGAWVRVYNGPKHAQWYGALGDNTTDDKVALQAWLDSGGWLFLPFSAHYSSGQLFVKRLVFVEGAGMGFDARKVGIFAYPGSRIRFAANSGGILQWSQVVIDSTTTVNSNTALYFVQEGGAFSSWKNIGLFGGGGTLGVAKTSGFESRSRVFMDNVRCMNFPGKGFDLQGSADIADVSSDYGNTSLSVLRNCYASLNGSNGFHVRGRDSSVVTFDTCDANVNGGWGFWDQSIFGGLITGCHAAGNGQGAVGGGGTAGSAGGALKISTIVGKMIVDNFYVEGDNGAYIDAPVPHLIRGGLLEGGARNINTAPALVPPISYTSGGADTTTSTTGTTMGGGALPWVMPVRAGRSYTGRFAGNYHHPTTSTARFGVKATGGAVGTLRGYLFANTDATVEKRVSLASLAPTGIGDTTASLDATPAVGSPYYLPFGGDVKFLCTTSGTLTFQFATGNAADTLETPGPYTIEWTEQV